MGRRKKNLTAKEFASCEYMAMIHCTGEEIAHVMQMDYDTLARNIMSKYGLKISEFIKKFGANGNMSLRRAQWQAAEKGNITMQIWLGKQWLDQTEKQEMSISAIDDSTRAEVEAILNEASPTERDHNISDAETV